jgi:hypothetical protein
VSPAAGRALRVAAAVLLALGTAWAAWRATRPPSAEEARGAFAPEHAERARAALRRLLAGLAALQEADGGFALSSPEERPSLPEPEVKRTASSALAAWALVEGARVLGDEGLATARDRALGYLEKRLEPDGTFGRHPPNPLGGAADPGPEVTALAAGLTAFARSGEGRLGLAVGQASRALAARVAAGTRDGWQRALAAMALDTVVVAGRGEAFGRDPRRALTLGKTPAEPDCGDYRLAEAIVRVVREEPAKGDLLPEAVLQACVLAEPPVWSGETSDVPAWLLKAWLASRTRQGPAWFALALPAVEEAEGPGRVVPGGIYADRVAQTAAAALTLVLGLSSQVI